ncbi:transcription factor MYB59-like [Musa acuminata AAA Group]|uniref:transcription factor MYB59-like n=1 Tax=Musa acuminata AAA Group TaxID=214697 RepID=UPI0031DAA4BE
MVMVKEELRRGPWTEQEDLQLACFVALLGERRWDFIAQASGLNRTGKSCRMRWVNYLHPSLKRGCLTPQEEHLVLELHSRWGNRWSRIARKLPGRTDNEIKNYWRTHMRKRAQEEKRNCSPSATSSAPPADDLPTRSEVAAESQLNGNGDGGNADSVDEVWDEIALSSGDRRDEAGGYACTPLTSATPVWECCSGSLWKTEDEELDGVSFGF